MAELVGVIASAVAFATVVGQLATTITTLKAYWDQVNDAPEDLKWYIREIEIFSFVLADIKADIAQDSTASSLLSNKSVVKSCQLCSEATKELDTLLKDLERDINSSSRFQRSYAAVKIMMKKKNVEKYRSRLKTVTQLLSLSQQCYTRALIQLQPELLAKRMALSMIKSQTESDLIQEIATDQFSECDRGLGPSTDGTELGAIARKRKAPGIQHNAYKWRLQVPFWVTTKALEFAALRAPDGWTFTLRAYSIVSVDSQVIGYTMHGNIQGLQDLFASNQASPFDRVDINGMTLLHYACLFSSEDVIEFLLNLGVDHSIEHDLYPSDTALGHLLWSGSHGGFQRPILPALRCLLRRSDEIVYETEEETINGLLSGFHGTAEEFTFFQRECCPTYYQMPQSTRVAVAARCASGYWDTYDMPELVRSVIGKGPLSADSLQVECLSERGQKITLVHSIARKIGASLARLHRGQKWERDVKDKRRLLYEAWNIFFCDFVAANIDIHHVVGRKTPFSAFLSGYFDWCDHVEVAPSACSTALRIWLTDLKSVGVDLEDFGRAEKDLYNSRAIGKDYHVHSWVGGNHRLINFTYGTSPHDWHLWISEKSDLFAGEFWDMIQREEEVMPGAWPDDIAY